MKANPTFMELYNVQVTGVAPNITASRAGPNLAGASDINDVDGKGEELDIIYNPTRNWRIMANVAHQEVTKSNILFYGKQLLARMMPVIQQLSGRANHTYPVGWQIGDPLPATSETFGAYFNRVVALPVAIATLNEGNPSADLRNY